MSYKELPTKYKKQLPDDYLETIGSMETEELKKRVLESEGKIFEIESDKEFNDEIQKAKEELKKLTGPYSDAKKQENAKIKAILFTLENRGVEI